MNHEIQDDREPPFDATLKPGLRTNNGESSSATVGSDKADKKVVEAPAPTTDQKPKMPVSAPAPDAGTETDRKN